MFFWNKFCGLIILFFILTNSSYAQSGTAALSTSKNISLKNNFLFVTNAVSPVSKKSFLTFYSDPSVYSKKPSKKVYVKDASLIPANFATCDYGFFCRQELKIEKATKVPIRFRLGSLEQCNYYEGKH